MSPAAALSDRPFYEEWWFLLVMALVGLILILVLVFALLLHGHSTKYKACSTGLYVALVTALRVASTTAVSSLCCLVHTAPVSCVGHM